MDTNAVSPEPVRLKDYTPAPRIRLKGWSPIISMMLFVGFFYAFMLPNFAWVIDIPQKKAEDLSEIMVRVAMLIAFALMVLSLLWPVFQGIYGLRRRKIMKVAKAQYPERIWLWDYPWQHEGSGRLLIDLVAGFGALLVGAFFLIVINMIAFAPDNSPALFKIIVLVIDILIGVAVVRGIYRGGTLFLKTGGGYRLLFNQFPFYLGDRMSLELVGVPSEAVNLQLSLRCVEAAYESFTGEDGSSLQGGYYQLYHESRNVFSQNTSEKSSLAMEWDLPDNSAWVTSLNKRPIRFWELEVKSQTPEVKYDHKFLLPVYGRA